MFAQDVYADQDVWKYSRSFSFLFNFVYAWKLTFILTEYGDCFPWFHVSKGQDHTRQKRNCLSHLECGSVESISRKCIRRLAWVIFAEGPTPFSPLSKVFGSGLQKHSFVVFEYCLYFPLTLKCFSFSVALCSSPLLLDDTQARPVPNVRI